MFTDRWLTLGIGNQVKLKRCHAAVALKGLGLCDLMKGKIAVTRAVPTIEVPEVRTSVFFQ